MSFRKYLNEGKVPDNVAKAVKSANTFMNVGKELKTNNIKYEFSTSPLPIYLIKDKNVKYAIINKKYADKPEMVIGDIAVGILGKI